MLIILAGAFGAVALFVYLLFRQLKKISWQLTQLRVERDSERILHDIGLRTQPPDHDADQRAGPVRRKRHLALYVGGNLTAALAELRDLSRQKRQALLASGAAAMAALGAIGLLLVVGSKEIQPDDEQSVPSDAVSSAPPEPGAPRPDPATPGASSGPAGHGEDDDSSQVISLTDMPSSRPIGPPGATGHPPRGSTSESASSPTTRASPTPSHSLPAPAPAASALPYTLCVDHRALRELRVCVNL
ncbi:hypothetical protein ACIP4X_17610 [Streptomyces sp. NPDC088817]|uniref:hypothetical protein n=1 Tax=Streptomyces sp. NPDC088817 TaxID=3365907 RepID=UPI0038183539